MKRELARFLRSVVLCAIMAMIALPAGASARSQAQLASFRVNGTNGYSLEVRKQGAGTVAVFVSEETPPIATISVTGGIKPPNPGSAAMTSYLTQGSANQNLIEADLGSLGRISASFQPSGEVRVTQLHLKKGRKCNGPRRFVRRLGTFVGTIEFFGEGGYTTVDAITARGSVGDFPFTGCYPKTVSAPSLQKLEAFAYAGRDVFDGVRFTAFGGPHPSFVASEFDTIGENQVFVAREARAVGPEDSFGIDGESLIVAPPPPFAGRAVLRHARSDSRSWSGDLSVNFPGVSMIPLTGPSFHTRKAQWLLSP